MRRASFVVAVMTVLSLYAGTGRAASYSFGKVTLSASVIEWENLLVKATGNARLVSAPPDANIAAGTMRLSSIEAKEIRVDLLREKGGQVSIKSATASGGVTIKAKRADAETDAAGKTVTVVRDVNATAQNAVLSREQDTIVLTGNVIVKIVEPEKPQPFASITGNTVTYYMKENRIQVKGHNGSPAAITVTPAEEVEP